jgi:small subunit ribosomal protein S6
LRKYEVMLILPPDVEESAVGAITDRIGQIIGERGGEITRVDRWGKRRLAYEINRQSEGYYVVAECRAEPDTMRELDRVLSLADNVVRFKVVVRGEAEAPAAREASVSAAQEPSA